MNKFHQSAFLCGYFNVTMQEKRAFRFPEGWKELVYPHDVVEEYKKFFYPEFVDFNLSVDKPGCIHSYRYEIQQDISFCYDNKEIYFYCKNITAYVMPYNILIYSIEIEQETGELDRITRMMSSLRAVMYYKEDEHSQFIEVVIKPILELYSLTNGGKDPVGFDRLVENGNKLKIFQIINSDSFLDISEESKDVLLFELGTLSKIGAYEKHEDNGISTGYLTSVLQKNKVSFYNNWSALSLLDTFTILSVKAPSWLLENWVDTYFRLIYIHGLFLKFYLFRLNIRFRKDADKISKLEDELVEFESTYCFPKISYNFLPLEIYKIIDTGLEISEERSLLYHLIDVENQRREKKNDKKVNKFLIFLTLLTMFSTLWDSSCLFNELYPYSEYVGSTVAGYKMVVSFLSLIIVIVIILIFNKKKK